MERRKEKLEKSKCFLYLIRYFIMKTKDSKQSVKNLDFGNIFQIKYRNHVKKMTKQANRF